MPEDPLVVSISSNSLLHPDEIARKTFPTARRGLDAEAVRRYLDSLSSDVRELLELDAQVRRRLADAERRAAEPEIDEATLTRAVGSETARILQTAHQAARDVIATAEVRAAQLLEEADGLAAERSAAADEEAAGILAEAKQEAVLLGAATVEEVTALRVSAQREADELIAAAGDEAGAVLAATKQECRQMVREARELRHRVLNDLADRRRALRVQLAQLRTGRDSLIEVVDAVGDVVDKIRDRLATAEHEARLAAAQAGEAVEQYEHDEDVVAPQPEDSELVMALAVDEGLAVEAAGAEVATAPPGDDSATAGSAAVPGPHRSVGELFARLRGGRGSGHREAVIPPSPDESAPSSEPVIEGPPDEEGVPVDPVSELDLGAHAREAPVEGDGVLGDSSAHEAAVAELEEDRARADEPGPPGAEEEKVPSEAELAAAALSRRTEMLSPVMTRLSRALKRALQDDQNELLDSIRHSSAPAELDSLLPAEAHRSRYEQAAALALSDAWTVGRLFVTPEDEGDPTSGGAEKLTLTAEEAGRELGAQLAAELTALLRHRLADSLAAAGGIGGGAHDITAAAYREWKGPRIEAVAGDFAIAAFSRGEVTAGEGSLVRWVVDDDGQPCPDCDDNSLAGPQAAGEPFPTGQPHPPVHSGCRCLLVSATGS